MDLTIKLVQRITEFLDDEAHGELDPEEARAIAADLCAELYRETGLART